MMRFRKVFVVLSVMVGMLATLAPTATAGPDFEFGETIEVAGDEYVHGFTIKLGRSHWMLAGPADSPNGNQDIPGHYWVQTGRKTVKALHLNWGPAGVQNWWSTDADGDAILYEVTGRLDMWTAEKAAWYASKGFTHYHELVKVDKPTKLHPKFVVWLKHVSDLSFTLDGGPHPEGAHEVTPGIDFEFINNWSVPYDPSNG